MLRLIVSVLVAVALLISGVLVTPLTMVDMAYALAGGGSDSGDSSCAAGDIRDDGDGGGEAGEE